MPRSPRHVAAIVASMFLDFRQPRMRISEKTLRVIGQRNYLRDSHKAEVARLLEEDFGLALIQIPRGFCVMRFTSLDGTKSRSFKSYRTSTTDDFGNEDAIWKAAKKTLSVDHDETDQDD